MSRLSEIQNELARERGFEDFNHLLENTHEMEIIRAYFNKSSKLYAAECCRASLEKASVKTTEQYVRPITLNYGEIKNLIINPDNIVLL